jgi:hypothetical protein
MVDTQALAGARPRTFAAVEQPRIVRQRRSSHVDTHLGVGFMPAEGDRKVTEYIGRSGYVGGYRVAVSPDRVNVVKDGVVVADVPVPRGNDRSIDRFLDEAESPQLGWGRLPSGDEILALFDARRPRHGFVVNLSEPGLSGWSELPAPLTSVGVAPERAVPRA